MGSVRVLHGSHNGVHVLCFEGEIRYPMTPAVQRFVSGLFSAESVRGFVIDLTRTLSIDSTNLGELARIANRMRESQAPRITLISDREDINEILESMGFEGVFDIVERAAHPRETSELFGSA